MADHCPETSLRNLPVGKDDRALLKLTGATMTGATLTRTTASASMRMAGRLLFHLQLPETMGHLEGSNLNMVPKKY
jgi:hypothetical protein